MLERRFNAVFDIDRTMEIPGRKRLRQVDFTEAVFYLAMRLAFKASMKPVEFKVTSFFRIQGSGLIYALGSYSQAYYGR